MNADLLELGESSVLVVFVQLAKIVLEIAVRKQVQRCRMKSLGLVKTKHREDV